MCREPFFALEGRFKRCTRGATYSCSIVFPGPCRSCRLWTAIHLHLGSPVNPRAPKAMNLNPDTCSITPGTCPLPRPLEITERTGFWEGFSDKGIMNPPQTHESESFWALLRFLWVRFTRAPGTFGLLHPVPPDKVEAAAAAAGPSEVDAVLATHALRWLLQLLWRLLQLKAAMIPGAYRYQHPTPGRRRPTTRYN